MIFKRILLVIFGAVLAVDGVYLLCLGRLHLGTVLPALLGGLFLGLAIYYPKYQQMQQRSLSFTSLCRWAWRGFFIWFVSLAIFFGYLQSQSHFQIDPEKSPVAIIVLGSQVRNGQPSPALANRLDKAASLAKQYEQAKVVVTGGLGYKQIETEAAVMGRYLQTQHQIPVSRIIFEDQSTSTELNLKNAEPLLANENIYIDQPIAIVTNDFHSLRARKIAEKIGFKQVISISADTPLLTRYNSWLREYFAYLSGWVLREY